MERHSAIVDEQFIKEVEELLGWQLDPEQRDEALYARANGESPSALADRIESLQLARDALNRRDASLTPPATRPADDDPRRFPKPSRR
jgi:hypothetical protein